MNADRDTPIPCRRCGAPMREESEGPRTPHEPVSVRCEFCGAREPLAADAAQRVTMLRLRLAEIRSVQEAIEAPALAIAQVAETYPRMVGPGALLLIAIAVLTSVQGFFHSLTLPSTGGLRLGVLLAAGVRPFQVLFLVASLFGGAILALRRYASTLRPALEARPGTVVNQYRCRGCGGGIEPAARHGAFVTCSHCNAPNLLGPSSAAHRAGQLDREIEEYRARARGQAPVIADAAADYRKRLHVLTAVVAGANVLLTLALSALQQALATAGP